uniref:Mitochondrial substrate carrier family protein M n=1 Tax=Aegilops tauschii TaxID=37682 RepID=N1QZK2_AEGTA
MGLTSTDQHYIGPDFPDAAHPNSEKLRWRQRTTELSKRVFPAKLSPLRGGSQKAKRPPHLSPEMPPGTPPPSTEAWTWENAGAGATAGFATVATFHPLDVVRTRFQGIWFFWYLNYECGAFNALFISELYQITTELNKDTCRRRMFSSVLSTILPQLQKQVCLFTNPIWLVKTRMQLQTPGHTSSYSGFSASTKFCDLAYLVVMKPDALRTIRKEEGWRALYRGIGPGLLLIILTVLSKKGIRKVTHGAIQFTAYEELRKAMISAKSKQTRGDDKGSEDLLVIRARLQQRPGSDGIPKYSDSWHVVKETARYEGVRGFYRGITSNLLKNLPAASVTFVVYENVIKLFRATKEKT